MTNYYFCYMIVKEQGLRKRTWAIREIFLPFAAISSKARVQFVPQTPGTNFFLLLLLYET